MKLPAASCGVFQVNKARCGNCRVLEFFSLFTIFPVVSSLVAKLPYTRDHHRTLLVLFPFPIFSTLGISVPAASCGVYEINKKWIMKLK